MKKLGDQIKMPSAIPQDVYTKLSEQIKLYED